MTDIRLPEAIFKSLKKPHPSFAEINSVERIDYDR
jgi:hypothetical protein